MTCWFDTGKCGQDVVIPYEVKFLESDLKDDGSYRNNLFLKASPWGHDIPSGPVLREQ